MQIDLTQLIRDLGFVGLGVLLTALSLSISHLIGDRWTRLARERELNARTTIRLKAKI